MVNDIALLPGDGVGPEVIAQAIKVLEAAEERFGLHLSRKEALIGGAAIDATGSPLPDETLTLCRESTAILLGAVGGEKWDKLDVAKRPEKGLLVLRKEFDLFANLRPVTVYPALAGASPLRPEIASQGVDMLIVRELTGGLYYGQPKHIEETPQGERAVDSMVYTRAEIERVAHVAFRAARSRRKKVTSVDKANVLECSALWRKVVTDVARDYRDVTLNHMLVDAAAMRLITHPGEFDVILTENTFGDILSDEASVLVGSLGMLPSAALGSGPTSLYEPVHGSAPDIAGHDVANPIGAVLAGAMMLEFSFGATDAAQAIGNVVVKALQHGYRTRDLHRPDNLLVSTSQMGEALARLVREA